MRVLAALQDRGLWAATLAGSLLPLAFAPFDLFWLAPLLLLVLFRCWDDVPPRTAAWRGFAFGFAAFATGTYWLIISIHGFGGSPLWLALFLMLALFALMASYHALCGWFVARSESRIRAYSWCLAWPGAWVLMEWLRGWLLTGFPWLSLGYGQLDGPLAAWAPVGGVYGVSFLTAMIAGLLLCLWRGDARDRVIAAIGLFALAVGTWVLTDREWTGADGPALDVALVQGSIPQDQKWLPRQRRPTLRLYRDLTFNGPPADLVVWPEVAVPAMAHEVDAYLDDVQERAVARDMQLLLGIMVYDFDREQFYNSLLAVGPQQGVYHKRHLVPFGEFFPVPDFVREWMRLMSLPYRDAAHGKRDQPPLRAGDVALSPSICYEDAFGAEQLDFLPESGLLVNVSNDAWFGDSIAPHQHLQMARMRSLETGRPMLRTTNTGITAIIGPDGVIVDQVPQFETVVLRGRVRAHTGSTPYIVTGNLPVLALAFLVAIVGWVRRS